MSAPHVSTGGPTISVVVNTCDRAAELRTLLFSLFHQTYDDFEVVVVLGPTRDDSAEMIREELGDRVHLVRCPEFNLSCSRNLGLAHAAGEVVAFIDDDSVASPTWLEQLAAVYSDHPEVAGVGGRTYQIHPEIGETQFLNGLVSVVGEQDDVRFDPGRPVSSATPQRFWFPRFHGTNMSYRREALLAIGGFDERFEYLCDDADLGVRLGRAGYLLRHSSQATVYHAAASRRTVDEFVANLNWYCLLRSLIYFTLKHGRKTVGLWAALAGVSHHAAHFRDASQGLLEQGLLSPERFREVRADLRRAMREGLYQGLIGGPRMPGEVATLRRELLRWKRPEAPAIAVVPPYGLGRKDKVMELPQEPLRVCLLSAGYPPRSTEGVARSTYVLARGLAELGHEVHVVTASDRHRVVFRDGAYVHEVRPVPIPAYAPLGDRGFGSLEGWLSYSHAAWEEVRSLVVNHRIQIVDSALWNLDSLVTAVEGSVPVVVRVVTAMKQIAGYLHTEATAEHRLMGDLEGELLDLAATVVSNTEATAETLAQVYGFDTASERHEVVHYGIVPVEEEALSTASSEEPTVLFVGRLEIRKGVLDLFEAIPRVLAEHPEARFVLAGSDNSVHDGFHARHGVDYPTWFARRHPRLRDRVDFLGYVDEERLGELYRDCDVFVAPSLYESFGLIYLEAMNYARPVIGCRAGGPREIIRDGETGRLVEPGDGAGLAAAITELIADPRRCREMGRAGRELLLRSFTHKTMATGFAGAYRRTLQR